MNSSRTDSRGAKNKFLEMRSWEKFRELCTKAFEEMIKKENEINWMVQLDHQVPFQLEK